MKKLMILMLFICMTTFAQISDKKVYVVDDELIVEQTADNKGLKITGYDDQSASYARLNLDADGYAIMNVKNRLYFQILELNRMAFYPNTFRLNDNFTLAYGTNEDFQWIFDEESSGALLLKNASKSTLISFTDQGSSVQFNVNGEIVTNNPINSQGIRTLTPVADDADNFLTAFTGNNLYGGRFVANAAGTAQLPEIGIGMNLKIGTLGDIEVKVDPNISNNLILDGVQLSNGADATNLSSAGDYMDLEYFDSDTWWAETNGWSAQTFALLMADTATTKLWVETDSVGIVTGNSTGGDEVQILYNKNRTALGANEYTSDFSVDEDGWAILGDGDETSSLSVSGSALQLDVTAAGTDTVRPALYHADDIMEDGEWYVVKMPYTLNSGTCVLNGINMSGIYKATYGAGELASSGVMTFVVQADTSADNYYLFFDGTSEFDLTISEITIDSLPSYHLANSNLIESPRLTSDSLDFNGGTESLFNTADIWSTFDSLSVYMVVLQDSWTEGDFLFDGRGAGDFQVKQYNASPNLNISYITNTSGTDKLPLDQWGVITVVGDNTSATIQVNDSTASTPADAGTIDARAFALGGTIGGSTAADMAWKALIVREGVDNATTQKIIQDSLFSKYTIPAVVTEEEGASSEELSPSDADRMWGDAYASGDDWILPSVGSTFSRRYFSISAGDTITVKATVTQDSLQWVQLRMYEYSSKSPLTYSGPTQYPLWGAHEDSADIWWTTIASTGAQYLTIELSKTSYSPDTTGIVTIHDVGVYKGVTDQLPSGNGTKAFSEGGMAVGEDGQFIDGTDTLFIWGVYPSGSNEYSTYAAQGFNAVIGNYLGANDLDSIRGAGMYAMPNIAQYLIVGGSLYADTADFRSRIEGILATDSGTDSLILYWDNEQYSEYQNVMDIMAIKEELIPEVPVIANMGSPGMLRLWREEVEAVMTYGNQENTVPKFKIIDNMNDDSLNPPGSMTVQTIFYDQVDSTTFGTNVIRSVNAGAWGVGLFKDGIPSDVAPEPGELTDITEFELWDYLPTIMDSVNTLLGL